MSKDIKFYAKPYRQDHYVMRSALIDVEDQRIHVRLIHNYETEARLITFRVGEDTVEHELINFGATRTIFMLDEELQYRKQVGSLLVRDELWTALFGEREFHPRIEDNKPDRYQIEILQMAVGIHVLSNYYKSLAFMQCVNPFTNIVG